MHVPHPGAGNTRAATKPRRRSAALALLPLASILIQCGSGVESCDEVAQDEACLTIVHRTEGALIAYPEGYVVFIRVTGDGVDFEEKVTSGAVGERSVPLGGGAYSISTELWQCGAAGCEADQGQPQQTCAARIEVAPGERPRAIATNVLGDSCSIRVID